MTAEFARQICETIMLIMFGLSWPISIYKSWSLKFVRGKSPIFLSLVIVGYAAGVMAKIFKAYETHQTPEWTMWLYAFNGLLVILDLTLYFRYRHNHEPLTKDVAEDIAHIIEDELEHHKQK